MIALLLVKMEDEIHLKITERGLTIGPDKPTSGTFGHVYFATKQNHKFAIKIFDTNTTDSILLNELSGLEILSKYSGIPSLFDMVLFNNDEKIFLIMDYRGKTLNGETLMGKNKLLLLFDFLSIYQNLYQNQIVHGDIKINNICINKGKLTLIDFGFAQRAPYIVETMEILNINKHLEFFSPKYKYAFIDKIDLLSIFNLAVYFFNCHNTTSYHCYPKSINCEKDQLYNLIYILLINGNNQKKRNNILEMIKKLNCTYQFDDSIFHSLFAPSKLNEFYYRSYQKIIKNIPLLLYKHLKKLLNINPKKRISYGNFYHKVMEDYPQYFPKLNKEKINLEKIFDNYATISCKNTIIGYLNTKYSKKYHPKVYSLTLYRFTKAINHFDKNKYSDLFNIILYCNYTTMVESIFPSFIGLKLDEKMFIEYIYFVESNFFGDNPYLYLKKMNLFRWTPNKHLLFDYFLTIFSTNISFCLLDPYLLCLLITILVARSSQKIPIRIVTDDPTINKPSTVVPIILTKKTLKIFLENDHIIDIINKMYGYYATLYHDKQLIGLDKYYIKKNANFKNLILFYQKQVDKYYAID